MGVKGVAGFLSKCRRWMNCSGSMIPANEVAIVCRSGPSNYVQEDATGKGEQEPQKDFKGKAAADPADL